MKPGSVAYYASAHGYGHGVRSCDVVRALRAEHPDVAVTMATELPTAFLENRVGAPLEHRKVSLDVGMVQLDSIRVDVEATLARVEELYSRRRELVEREAAFLRQRGVTLVVADVAALPLEAAAGAGIPAVAVGNFAWDWIYEEYVPRDPRWAPIVEAFREGYGRADLLLRLPFHDAMGSFRRIEDVPLVARPGRARRAEIATRTGARADRSWVLLSFTTLALDDRALDAVEGLDGYEFFTVQPLAWRRRNIHPIDRAELPFLDVVASVDTVVSKPGFGIVSECIVNRKPLVYADRSDFREYRLLVDGIERHLRHAHIPSDRLYAGDLGDALAEIERRPPAREALASGGDVIAARRLAELARR